MTFYELEKECKKRRLKRYILFSGLGAIVIGIGVFIYFQLNKSKEVKPIKVAQKKVIKPKQEANISKPKIKPETKKVEKIEKQPKELAPIVDLPDDIEINKTKKPIKFIETKPLPSYNTCISLAKRYLKKGDYEEAIKWAKNANLQDKDKPQSWIITAKALYKQGKKEEAIRILKVYYNYTKNKEIKRLIDEMAN